MSASLQSGLFRTNLILPEPKSKKNPPSSRDFPTINSLSKNCCVFHRVDCLTTKVCDLSAASFLAPESARHLSSLRAEREKLCCELLWLWPLCHWNLGVIFPGRDWLGSVTALCYCQASTVNERPPWSSLEINFSQNLAGPGQIWEGAGIYGMACQVGISDSLYKSEASNVTYLTSTWHSSSRAASFWLRRNQLKPLCMLSLGNTKILPDFILQQDN